MIIQKTTVKPVQISVNISDAYCKNSNWNGAIHFLYLICISSLNLSQYIQINIHLLVYRHLGK